MTLVSVRGLSVNYGPIPALRSVDLDVGQGETLAVVGANGAGKSTLTLAITGVIRPAGGAIELMGKSLLGLVPEAISRLGVALVPEGRHIFEGLTVAENLRLGMTSVGEGRQSMSDLDGLYARFPILGERRNGMATRLSGGEQQQLAIARALLSRPKLLILDEPSLGLAPVMVDRVYETLADLKAQGMTILLIEQNPGRIEDIADRVMILSGGAVQQIGPTSDVVSGRDIGAAYLGISS